MACNMHYMKRVWLQLYKLLQEKRGWIDSGIVIEARREVKFVRPIVIRRLK